MDVLRFSIERDVTYNECGIMNSEEPWIHLPRIFKMWVLGLVTRGTLYMNIEGTDYKIMPGDVFLLPAMKLHWGQRASDGAVSYYWIHFHAPRIEQMLQETGLDAHGVEADQSYMMLHFSLLDLNTVSVICGQLYANNYAQHYTPNLQQSLLKALLYEISNQTLLNHAHKFDQKFVKLLDHIRANFASPISIDDLAERFEYNKHYLCRLFKQRTGKTIITYYTQLRICYACQQLSETNYPIKRISRDCGFENEKYFMRLFKEHMNMTPTQYRNSHMIAIIND